MSTSGKSGDAQQRTNLANERTYLAWWRTGLTTIAVSVAIGRVLPEIAHGTRWPYAVVGAGFGLLAVAVIAYGLFRHRVVARGVRDGTDVGLDDRAAVLLTACGVLLSMAAVALIVVR